MWVYRFKRVPAIIAMHGIKIKWTRLYLKSRSMAIWNMCFWWWWTVQSSGTRDTINPVYCKNKTVSTIPFNINNYSINSIFSPIFRQYSAPPDSTFKPHLIYVQTILARDHITECIKLYHCVSHNMYQILAPSIGIGCLSAPF